MRKTTLYITLILLAGILFPLQAAPRLTVVVLVDGLRSDNLNMMQPYWPTGGLRTLTEEGQQFAVQISHPVYGGAETVATLLTGETPSTHGIAMNHYFQRSDRTIHPILEDMNESGIGSIHHISPRRLLSPALADRFRLTYGKDTHIFAVGQDPETTVLMAGHAADGCCWMNPQTLQWATTSYYRAGLPATADAANISERTSLILEREWQPRMDIRMYMYPTDQETKNGFSYRNGKYLTQVPAINTLTIELALALQKEEHLGEDSTPDLLLLQLTTCTPKATGDLIRSAEQEDIHLALNQDFGYLMEQLHKRVGKHNLQLLVAGIPRQGIPPESMEAIGMPVRRFNVDRAAALTNAYLMAIYGHERWVDGGCGQAIYLNRLLLEQKKIPIENIRQQVADFLMDFDGIRVAHPLQEACLDPLTAASMNKLSAGDVVFVLQPGWQLSAGEENAATDHVLEETPDIPLLLWTEGRKEQLRTNLVPSDIIQLITNN